MHLRDIHGVSKVRGCVCTARCDAVQETPVWTVEDAAEWVQRYTWNHLLSSGAGPCAAAALLAESWLLGHHSVTLTALKNAFRRTRASKSAAQPFASVCVTGHVFHRGATVGLKCVRIAISVHASWEKTSSAWLRQLVLLGKGWLRGVVTPSSSHVCPYCQEEQSPIQFCNFSCFFAPYCSSSFAWYSSSLSTSVKI